MNKIPFCILVLYIALMLFLLVITYERANLMKTLKQYEKALDKACEELAEFEYALSNYHFNEHKSEEQWKDYLLKESEK